MWFFVVLYFVFIEMVRCLVAQSDFGLVETVLRQPPKRWGYRSELHTWLAVFAVLAADCGAALVLEALTLSFFPSLEI